MMCLAPGTAMVEVTNSTEDEGEGRVEEHTVAKGDEMQMH